MTAKSIILTISAGSSTRRRIWSGVKPIAIGGGRRWRLERTPEGVRLQRMTDAVRGENQQERAYEFRHEELEGGAKLELEGLKLQLKTTVQLPPAHTIGAGTGRKFRVYQLARGWTLGTRLLGSTYVAEVDGGTVFRIVGSGSEYQLTAYSPEMLSVSTERAVHELGFGQTLILSAEELALITIRSGVYAWTFNRPEEAMIAGRGTGVEDVLRAARRELLGPVALAATFLIAALLWPEVQVEKPAELQIVQVPKITLTKPVAQRPAAMGSGASAVKTAQKKGAPSAAPAFQGDKLQSAMKGLFRGGMTQLLAKSEYGPGADKSDSARKLFNSSSPALHSTAPVTGPGVGKGTQVTALGGGGEGTGKGVGYGHGEHANVQGQGRSYVAMDTSGSNVEEGLSKDEVGRVIHRHMSEVRYCYEASILRNPELEGKLVLGFTIGASGKVKVAAVRSSTLTDSNLDDCIVRRLSAWKFPTTKGGIDVGVTYPFIFKTIGG